MNNISNDNQVERNTGSILVSVVVPTKNRHAQLFETLKANIEVGALPNVEFVVADNSAEPLSAEKFEHCRSIFANFVYANDPATKSIIDNFNFGLGLASGKYVIFIGDDDFVLPELVPAAEFAQQKGIECLIYEPDKYYWESCVFVGPTSLGPKCLIKNQPAQARAIDAAAELRKSARNGFLTIESLPRAYHGLVDREKLGHLSGTTTKPIIGGSPDISMAVSLAIKNVRTYFWHTALSIYGASTGSGGGMTTSKTHLLPLHKATFLDKDFVAQWSQTIPHYWSEYTVFPASALYIHRLYGVASTEFNLAATYASILVNESQMARDVLRTFRALEPGLKSQVARRFPSAFVRKLGGWTVRKMRDLRVLRKPDTTTVTHGISHLDVLGTYSA